jgi:hypothetical protein
MTRTTSRTPRRGVVLLLSLLAAACTDSTPLAPTPEPTPVEVTALLQCSVDVASAAMTCRQLETGGTAQGISATRIFGSQNRNVRLASSGGSYDAGTQIFQTNVTVQNLTPQALGLDSLGAVTGVRVFFSAEPTVTSGPGPVTVYNPSGATPITTGAPQAYFEYIQVLAPNEISSSMQWQFQVPSVTTTFSFMVSIQASQPDEDLQLTDKVWDGSESRAWGDPANWEGNSVPDSGSFVLIPAVTSNNTPIDSMPVLAADVQITDLTVNAGASLTLNSNTLTAWGSVDALGTISGGTLWMRGTGTYLGGNLPSVVINGGTMLQRSSVATGAMSISDGSLVVDGSKPLSISIP